jgi:small basic protein (TIGR04137 family)
MSLDKSLKSKGTLARHRNVLKRSERIERLKDAGDWSEDRSPFGLPKVAHRKVTVGKKEKKKGPETTDAAAPAAKS